MKFLEDGTYIIRFGKLYKVEFPKSFLDDCNKVEIPNWKVIPVTNAQKIRSMTDEELARWVNFHTVCEECPASKKCNCAYTARPDECTKSILQWLKEEATDA